MGISSVKTLEASAHSDHSASAVNIHERPTARDNPNPSVANRWKCPAPQRPVEFFEVFQVLEDLQNPIVNKC